MLARRSPDRHIYLFCAIWIVLTMAPALNLDSILWLVDDRYLYTPSFGWSLAVAAAADSDRTQRFHRSQGSRRRDRRNCWRCMSVDVKIQSVLA